MPFGMSKKTKDTGVDDVVDTRKDPEVAMPEQLLAPEEKVATLTVEDEADAAADGDATEEPVVGDVSIEEEKDEIDGLLGDIFEEEDSKNDDVRSLASNLPEVEIGELVAMTREIAERMGLSTAT